MQSALLPHSAFAPVFTAPPMAFHDLEAPRRFWLLAVMRWLGVAGHAGQ
jgi:hypothetical protein